MRKGNAVMEKGLPVVQKGKRIILDFRIHRDLLRLERLM